MTTQLTLKLAGMKSAVDHANAVHAKWSEEALAFIKTFAASQTGDFMAEDIRKASEGIVPEPPSLRAWGGVISRAAREGIIRMNGYGVTKSSKAHNTPASKWRRN